MFSILASPPLENSCTIPSTTVSKDSSVYGSTHYYDSPIMEMFPVNSNSIPRNISFDPLLQHSFDLCEAQQHQQTLNQSQIMLPFISPINSTPFHKSIIGFSKFNNTSSSYFTTPEHHNDNESYSVESKQQDFKETKYNKWKVDS